MALEDLLTLREPLGPIDQSNIRVDQDADRILDADVPPFSQALSRVPILLLGRKGSGKSSILVELRMRQQQRPDRYEKTDTPPPIGSPFLITIGSWDHFHQLTRHVATQYSMENAHLDPELIPAEYLARLWQDALWDEIIKHFYNFCHHPEGRDSLAAVEKYVVVDGQYTGSAASAARRLLDSAKASVLRFLEARRSRLFLLIDSMERYPVRNLIFNEVLSGLLQGINRFHYDSPLVTVTFCLPEEIEDHLQLASANVMKDYSSLFRIRWRPIELLKITAHRLRLFVQLNNAALYKALAPLNLDTREGIHDLFERVLPEEFTNGIGVPEDPLAYVIRHTQLLPRHIIAIFNSVVSKCVEANGTFDRIDRESLVEGVAEAEQMIAQQVLVPYQRIYPQLLGACSEVLPQLRSVVSYSDLVKASSRFPKGIDRAEDVYNVWKTLYQIGVIGRLSEESISEQEGGGRYHFAHFKFNTSGSFGLVPDAVYCFHPVFSRHFGVTRPADGDTRAIYPAGLETRFL